LDVADSRVLLVDDEEELVSALAARLAYRRVEADYVTCGKDALEKLSSKPYDVVVIDLKLPGMSGEELAGQVSKSYPEIPILMMTGHGVDEDRGYQKPPSIMDLLPKPIDIDQLVARMREAIESK
jgi:DNA-binding response OmpR family regulator